jgi:hypothetical protein
MSTGQGVLGNNMFAYCLNHPITMVDYHGHDAIYVVDTSAEQGLPVVGHAIVYIQDSAGNWYMTEYSGVFPDKTTARIRFVSASTEEVEKIIQGEAGKNIQYMYISGDFSESVAIAQTYMGTDFSGYNLLFNNCADYAQMVLLEGSFDDRFERLAISTTGSPIPVDLLRSIAEAKMFSAIWGGITDGIERLWEAVTK